MEKAFDAAFSGLAHQTDGGSPWSLSDPTASRQDQRLWMKDEPSRSAGGTTPRRKSNREAESAPTACKAEQRSHAS